MPDLPVAFEMARTTESPTAIAAMAAHPDVLCRLGAAANAHSQPPVLMVLGFDSCPQVALQALIHPRHPGPDVQRLQSLLEQVESNLDPDQVALVQAAVERTISRAGG